MAYWADFDNIFNFNKKYHYETKVVELIVNNRKVLENQLFADRLLGLLGIKGGTYHRTEAIHKLLFTHTT